MTLYLLSNLNKNLILQLYLNINILLCSTILYEVFAGKWPFSFHPTHSVIWMIGKGQQQCVTHIQCPESLRVRTHFSNIHSLDSNNVQ